MKKKFFAFITVLTFCLIANVQVFASEKDSLTEDSLVSSVMPRVGIAGYTNHYHDGSRSYGNFEINCSPFLTSNEFTIETQNFDSSTKIVVEIYASDGVQMNYAFTTTGNGKWENKTLRFPLTNQTYTVKYDVYRDGVPFSGDDGWIGIWLY